MKNKIHSILFLLALALALIPLSVSASTLTIDEGKPVEISVTADGTQPFTYQWFKFGDPIPGATAVKLVIAKPVVNDSGTYTVRVSNAVGSTLSDDAVLTVKPLIIPPGNAKTNFATTTDGPAPAMAPLTRKAKK
jgi:hypothetical protein